MDYKGMAQMNDPYGFMAQGRQIGRGFGNAFGYGPQGRQQQQLQRMFQQAVGPESEAGWRMGTQTRQPMNFAGMGQFLQNLPQMFRRGG